MNTRRLLHWLSKCTGNQESASTYETNRRITKETECNLPRWQIVSKPLCYIRNLKQWDRYLVPYSYKPHSYGRNGSVDTATVSLERGKDYWNSIVRKMLPVFIIWLRTQEIEEKIKQAADNSNCCARMLIRDKDFTMVHRSIWSDDSLLGEKNCPMTRWQLMSKTSLPVTLLVQLSRGDSVAARMYLGKVGVVLQGGDDGGPVTKLLAAYEAGDQQRAF